jgi:predicted Zn-dependent peptidase
MKVLIVENHKLPRVSFNLTLDNAPFTEGNKKGVDELTTSLIGNGTKKTSKEAFNEEIDFYGANINFTSQGAFASALSKYSGRVLELLAEGALQPNFTQTEFDKEKAKLLEGLKADEKSVPAISNRVVDVLAFGKNHPSGEYLSEETVKNVTLEDVQKNYNTYFVPENAYLVIIGDVKFKETKAAVEKLFSGWKKQAAPKNTYPNPENASALQIDFVDVPNAVQSEISLVNTVNLKMSDPDFFPAVIANQILGGDFNSYLNMNLREQHAWTYGANSSIGSGKYVTKFKASSAVRNTVTDSAVVQFIKEIKRVRTERVDPEVLRNVKAGYIGRFVMQVEKPQAVARYALNIETEKLPADFYEKYIQTINNVTADDIYRVANKYFLLDNMRIVIVGKGSDVISGLEKLQIPIYYFDKYGNPVEKPAVKKEAPTNITAKTVFENYINAIGGEKAVTAVKTLNMNGTTKVPQAPGPLTFVSKLDSKGKMMVSLSMGTMDLMKQVVNEKGAYIEQQGKRKNLEGNDLKEMKANAAPFEELQLVKRTDLKVQGIEPINGSDAYAIKDGNTTHYYDIKTGLKVAKSKVREQDGKSVTQITNFNDYRVVKGVKVPFNLVQNIGFELDIKMTDIKINEDVSDADFL